MAAAGLNRPAVLALATAVILIGGFHFAVADYQRPPAKGSIFVTLSEDQDSSSPQQVHISMVGNDKMRISWITEDSGTPATVEYGTSPGNYQFSADGTTTEYTYLLYISMYRRVA